MSTWNIARVAVENAAYKFDKAYDYLIPSYLENEVKCGCRVMVPFGAGNNKRQGIVVELAHSEDVKKIKQISAVLDEAPLLNSEMLDLVLWLKERTFCTIFEAAKAILPPGINLRTVTSYLALPNLEDSVLLALNDDEQQIMRFLMEKGVYIERKKLLHTLGFDDACDIPERLVKKGLLLRNYDAIRKVNDASVTMVRRSSDIEELEGRPIKLTKKQSAVVELLKEVGSASVKEICYFTGITPAVISALEKKGFVEYYEKEVLRTPYKEGLQNSNKKPIHLTQEQTQAFQNLLAQYQSGQGGVSLLFGVTGSGKTQVFLKMIDEVLAQGRGVIVMVPEIALTPQTLSIFHGRYGKEVAVFHSALSLGERLDEWKRMKSGKAKIVVGTRSAVFAPLENIGLIIMDEEQEHTYKSEQSPRYHTRDVARFRCAKHQALLILASATPSVESYTSALRGKYSLNVLKERYGNAILPEVITVDMCKERSNGNKSIISIPLFEELENNIQDGHQSILLMNRRGYNTFVSCNSCGKTVTCPYCSISMTYHHANDRLMCHYCGFSKPFTFQCEACGNSDVRYSGFGTQRIEEELMSLFPEARILRMDTDTTMSRYAHEQKLTDFAKGYYDIMIGTQMVAKGLDFENVTLVGVLSADQQLYNDDYKSVERTFALLTQVVGRSGRGEHKGKAIIQTLNPENEIIQLAASQDYTAFYHTEINMRKAMIYPPYCDIITIGFSGTNETTVRASAKQFFESLKEKNLAEYCDIKMIILGPVPTKIAKVSNRYRYRIIIKSHNTKRLRNMLSELITDFDKASQYNKISTYVDINPESIY